MAGLMTFLWLPRLGSNQGFQLQRLTCYHYTTGQRLCRISIVLAVAAGVKSTKSMQSRLNNLAGKHTVTPARAGIHKALLM